VVVERRLARMRVFASRSADSSALRTRGEPELPLRRAGRALYHHARIAGRTTPCAAARARDGSGENWIERQGPERRRALDRSLRAVRSDGAGATDDLAHILVPIVAAGDAPRRGRFVKFTEIGEYARLGWLVKNPLEVARAKHTEGDLCAHFRDGRRFRDARWPLRPPHVPPRCSCPTSTGCGAGRGTR
jgi:hypothetical protein